MAGHGGGVVPSPCFVWGHWRHGLRSWSGSALWQVSTQVRGGGEALSPGSNGVVPMQRKKPVFHHRSCGGWTRGQSPPTWEAELLALGQRLTALEAALQSQEQHLVTRLEAQGQRLVAIEAGMKAMEHLQEAQGESLAVAMCILGTGNLLGTSYHVPGSMCHLWRRGTT